jgi:general secretion pathway protein G
MSAKWENTRVRLRGTASIRGGADSAAIIAVIVLVLLVIAVLKPRCPCGYGKKPKIQAAKTQIEGTFATALDGFEVAVGRYPTTAEGLRALVEKPATNPGNWTKPFLLKIPLDPWGNEYQYVYPGTHNANSYDLYSFGPDGKSGGGDDITNW